MRFEKSTPYVRRPATPATRMQINVQYEPRTDISFVFSCSVRCSCRTCPVSFSPFVILSLHMSTPPSCLASPIHVSLRSNEREQIYHFLFGVVVVATTCRGCQFYELYGQPFVNRPIIMSSGHVETRFRNAACARVQPFCLSCPLVSVPLFSFPGSQ